MTACCEGFDPVCFGCPGSNWELHPWTWLAAAASSRTIDYAFNAVEDTDAGTVTFEATGGTTTAQYLVRFRSDPITLDPQANCLATASVLEYSLSGSGTWSNDPPPGGVAYDPATVQIVDGLNVYDVIDDDWLTADKGLKLGSAATGSAFVWQVWTLRDSFSTFRRAEFACDGDNVFARVGTDATLPESITISR